MPDDAEKAKALLAHVRKFIATERISCAEAVNQNDNVILNAYAFIEGCCEIAGYLEVKDE